VGGADLRAHLLGVLPDVVRRRSRIIAGIFYAGPQGPLDDCNSPGSQRAPGDDASQRDRQTAFSLPPFPQIQQFVQAKTLVGETRFVDDQAGIGNAAANGVHNFVEGHDQEVFQPGIEQPQQQQGGCVAPWYGNDPAAQIGW